MKALSSSASGSSGCSCQYAAGLFTPAGSPNIGRIARSRLDFAFLESIVISRVWAAESHGTVSPQNTVDSTLQILRRGLSDELVPRHHNHLAFRFTSTRSLACFGFCQGRLSFFPVHVFHALHDCHAPCYTFSVSVAFFSLGKHVHLDGPFPDLLSMFSNTQNHRVVLRYMAFSTNRYRTIVERLEQTRPALFCLHTREKVSTSAPDIGAPGPTKSHDAMI
ncbi:hypothetical protein BKA66DRAFT_112270 [Pyrenochaeta sp. MPI-SDFR-AT-0127]|nr:hypothetical protein BKA66DRAFT_112270 [Pyrenochaeta sp. MPI-SDFR-AT-0127]